MNSSDGGSKPRFPLRLERWFHSKRVQRAKKRGKVATVIPFYSYGSNGWIRILGRTLLLHAESPEHQHHSSAGHPLARVRGWRSFTSVHAADESIEIFANGQLVATTKTDSGGVLDAVVNVDLPTGWHTVELKTAHNSTKAVVRIIDNSTPIGIICDVDDTILNTALPRPFVAAWNSFVANENARLATPGMPVLMDHLSASNPGAPVIYVSTGAWNVAPVLTRFLKRHLYPAGPFLLTDWGPTHDRWFRSGSEHKRRELRRIISEFPNTRWVLIGDDGQLDEEIYHEFSSEFLDHIAAVAIRQLSTGEAVLAGGRSKAQQHRAVSGVPWVYGPDGAVLRQQLKELGLIR